MDDGIGRDIDRTLEKIEAEIWELRRRLPTRRERLIEAAVSGCCAAAINFQAPDEIARRAIAIADAVIIEDQRRAGEVGK